MNNNKKEHSTTLNAPFSFLLNKLKIFTLEQYETFYCFIRLIIGKKE